MTPSHTHLDTKVKSECVRKGDGIGKPETKRHVMGSYAGHALPGSFFIVFALYWALRLGVTVHRRKLGAYVAKEAVEASTLYLASVTRIVPFRPWCFPILSFLGTVFLCIGAYAEFFVYGGGSLSSLSNLGHTAMYLSFAVPMLLECVGFLKPEVGNLAKSALQ